MQKIECELSLCGASTLTHCMEKCGWKYIHFWKIFSSLRVLQWHDSSGITLICIIGTGKIILADGFKWQEPARTSILAAAQLQHSEWHLLTPALRKEGQAAAASYQAHFPQWYRLCAADLSPFMYYTISKGLCLFKLDHSWHKWFWWLCMRFENH